MASDGNSQSFGRVLRLVLGAVLLLLVAFGGWFVTRKITPGGFVVRIGPAGVAPGGLVLSVLGPGGGKLGEWRFVDVPGPPLLAGLEKKIPWPAIASNAGPGRPCLTLEVAPFVTEAAVAPVERLALSQCCPGVTDVARCPIRRVVLGR
jgi:hypothetical protein